MKKFPVSLQHNLTFSVVTKFLLYPSLHLNYYVRVIVIAFFYSFLITVTGTTYAQEKGRPVITKLPFAFSSKVEMLMENTPVIFQSRVLLVANSRPGGFYAKGEDAYLFIDDMQTGQEISRFGKGHSFVSAYVNEEELNVFATEFTDFGKVINTIGINRLVTTDLVNWKVEKAIIPESGEHFFNSSVCRDDKGYIMAYESNKPVQFCFKFARSSDLSKWEKVPGLVFTGVNNEYSACPVIRYHKPYYYVIYLHAPVEGHNGWISYLARSRDLENWDLSPFNPILEAGQGEGRNNSDVDILEYEGKTYLFYATGDQETWGTVRVAMFDGPERTFFEKHFPKKLPVIKVSAKQ